MLKPYSAMLCRLIWGVADFERHYHWTNIVQPKEMPPESDLVHIRDYLRRLSEMAFELDLESVPPCAERMLRRLSKESESYTAETLSRDLEELRRRVLDQLDARDFLFIKRSRADYYQSPDQFGSEVSERFPAAIDDIEGAGRCLALGEGTACVLHLMRVMEVGLKELGRALGIPYAPSWESYLKQIQSKIADQYPAKTIDWKRDEPFFRDISGDLISVKQAWRNPSMHVVRKFSADEAEEIFKAVRSFMIRLAAGLPDPNVSSSVA
jgi:hypothetical protein